MNMRICEACGGQKTAIILDELSHKYGPNGSYDYRLLECRECGMGFIDPKPEWEVMETFYDESYGPYTPPVVEGKSLKYSIAKLRYAHIGSSGSWAIIRAVLGMACELVTGKTVPFTLGVPLQLPKDAKILDVGCGAGGWLLSMSDLGYTNLHGYDINSNSSDLIRLKSAGISVTQGAFLENHYPESSFDCILLTHVIEHLPQPTEVLSKIRRMLKPGGYLLINCPCKKSWSASFSFKHFDSLDMPRHLFHHTPVSISRILRKTGFRMLDMRVYGVMAVFGSTIDNYLRDKGMKTIPLPLFYPFSPIYSWLSTLTGKGDAVTVMSARRDE